MVPDNRVAENSEFGERANERRIRIGGLMRCCLQTISECTAIVGPGSVLSCRFCSDSMRVARDGVWEWNHD